MRNNSGNTNAPVTSNQEEKTGDESLPQNDYQSAKQSHVAFSTADIYIFLMTVGDNPAVTKGPPVQIEWKHHQAFPRVDVNELEAPKEKVQQELQEAKEGDEKKTKAPSWSNESGAGSFRLVRSRRISILKDQGFTMNEIQEAEKAAFTARTERKETIFNKRKEHVEERRETRRNFWSSKMSSFSRKTNKSPEQLQAEAFLERYEAEHAGHIHLSYDLDQLPSICKNCAEASTGDITTTRVGYKLCHGDCQGKVCIFTGKPLGGSKKLNKKSSFRSKGNDESMLPEQTSIASTVEAAA